ncbi:MAG TPA: FAD-dependent monooxygenase [Candidatus Acidoferrales bacterium]|nr:FAD-dependent monooxygenase [Candidatus Acidoferrales bacterium]
MRAVIIGASISGLLAARALSDFAESVLILDRDIPPETATPRKGVPQGRHVHGLLAGGVDALRFFFPTILDQLAAEGARVVDTGQDVLWFNGAWRLRFKCGVIGSLQTRPFLEMHLRRQMAKLANVHQTCGVAVTGVEMDARRSHVTGVRVREAGGDKTLPADLVVDCSGRGSQTPAWLEAARLEKPPAETVTVNVGYSTQYFRISEKERPDWHAMLILGRPPKGTRLGACFFVENGELQVTLGGEFRDYPPDDAAGFLEFAQSLENPAIFHAIKNATPVSSIATYRFPAHVWNHYERLKRLPVNLIVLGDALCSFNPVYGQGITVAAQEARALHSCFAEAGAMPGASRVLQKRYFQRAASIVNAAWAMATGADMAFPQAEARRSWTQGIILRYVAHVLALTSSDKTTVTVWNQVSHMQRPLSALFAPGIAMRVMRRAMMGSSNESLSASSSETPALR